MSEIRYYENENHGFLCSEELQYGVFRSSSFSCQSVVDFAAIGYCRSPENKNCPPHKTTITQGMFNQLKLIANLYRFMRFYVQHWISRYCVPLQLHSDQGRNFDSAVCKRLCEILDIDKTRTAALYPQCDGMVERFSRSILNSLSLLGCSNQQDRDKKLPLFLLVYRSIVHETIGFSPSQMIFGCDIRLPADRLFSQPPNASLLPKQYAGEVPGSRMEEIHHLARDRIDMASEKMKT
ncbi:retrovirus-related Pol polyprotein from transposon 412 [Trichonephila clavipes]|nr:retrovirus-related Pol polyprotein from transposon 412 [Trichonephila clavipes]